MRIGILALQGAFMEHKMMLQKLQVNSFEIRQPEDLSADLDGLIIPGGESTVIGKLMHDYHLLPPVTKLIKDGLPVFGTCAGLIMLAKDISGESIPTLRQMDITVKRNAFGRQLGSFTANADFAELGTVPMVFIRAPYIESISGQVRILANVNGKIVAARQKQMLVTAFHPELTSNTSIHKYFLQMI